MILESQKIEDFDFDIEKILDRIENLSFLMKRYGSIENALEILKQKKQELEHYENLSFEKKELEKKFEKAKDKLEKSTKILTQTRINNLEKLQNCLNEYLKNLYMKDAILSLDESKVISSMGKDEINLNINFANLKNLSSGELNRLRLAFIATECKILGQGSGILFLDEIDANLSGKEAMSIAMVLDELSNFYQIFAISHLPQLSSRAHNHFLVQKKGDESFVKKLNQEERIKELARMVSGEKINEEAIEFAKTLFKS